MNKCKKGMKHFQLALIFSVMIFTIMLLSMLIIGALFVVLMNFGIFDWKNSKNIPLVLISFAVICLITGTIIAAIISHIPLSPIREVIKGIDKLASGDFNTRINLRGPAEIQNLNNSFNHMAEELGSTELLRNDFVNNFSHEFKTPIVSIMGFAKMLKYNDLSQEERTDYLNIIIDESKRLSELATNVLNITKIENQIILSEKSQFNVTEQIRLIIAVLEPKWSKTNLLFRFECEEIFIKANEELLRQVWMNIIDNAIKFSPPNSEIEINIFDSPDENVFKITDHGNGMPPETAKLIFNKFYQGDTSHSAKGNGLGLTISRKIIQLHKGSIIVEKTDINGTTFKISLPKEM